MTWINHDGVVTHLEPHILEREVKWALGSIARSEEKVKVTQSYPTLCNPMDYTVHGILQARILEWIAFPFSRGSSQPQDQTALQVDSLPI